MKRGLLQYYNYVNVFNIFLETTFQPEDFIKLVHVYSFSGKKSDQKVNLKRSFIDWFKN